MVQKVSLECCPVDERNERRGHKRQNSNSGIQKRRNGGDQTHRSASLKSICFVYWERPTWTTENGWKIDPCCCRNHQLCVSYLFSRHIGSEGGLNMAYPDIALRRLPIDRNCPWETGYLKSIFPGRSSSHCKAFQDGKQCVGHIGEGVLPLLRILTDQSVLRNLIVARFSQ